MFICADIRWERAAKMTAFTGTPFGLTFLFLFGLYFSRLRSNNEVHISRCKVEKGSPKGSLYMHPPWVAFFIFILTLFFKAKV